MPASSVRIALAAAALAAAGAAHAGLFDDDEARKRIDEMRLSQEKSAKETAERIGRLEESVRNIGVVDLLRQIETLNAEIARLRGSLEVLANQNEQIQKRQRDFYLDLDSRLKRLEGGGSAQAPSAAPPAVAAAAEAAPPAKPPSKEEQAREVKAYDAASALFRRNDFASAAEAFRAFLKDYPQSALAPNATYWIGICQANLKDYKAALATQEGLLSRFPASPKAPDALLAIAAVQSEQGDHGSARNTLEDIIARYPGSEAAGKARTRLAAGKR
ncbi:MAG: tol-pal system protein YbgF [Betaproteobacteria bacterium]|nr:MAG: tol-pal system protein YbgF [Betaproteobacteria bacterium]